MTPDCQVVDDATLDRTIAFASELINAGDPREAERVLEGLRATVADQRGPDDIAVHIVELNLAPAVSRLGRHGNAADILARALEGFQRLCGPSDQLTLKARIGLGAALRLAGQGEMATRVQSFAAGEAELHLGPEDPLTALSRFELGMALMGQGDSDGAREQWRLAAGTSAPGEAGEGDDAFSPWSMARAALKNLDSRG